MTRTRGLAHTVSNSATTQRAWQRFITALSSCHIAPAMPGVEAQGAKGSHARPPFRPMDEMRKHVPGPRNR